MATTPSVTAGVSRRQDSPAANAFKSRALSRAFQTKNGDKSLQDSILGYRKQSMPLSGIRLGQSPGSRGGAVSGTGEQRHIRIKAITFNLDNQATRKVCEKGVSTRDPRREPLLPLPVGSAHPLRSCSIHTTISLVANCVVFLTLLIISRSCPCVQ